MKLRTAAKLAILFLTIGLPVTSYGMNFQEYSTVDLINRIHDYNVQMNGRIQELTQLQAQNNPENQRAIEGLRANIMEMRDDIHDINSEVTYRMRTAFDEELSRQLQQIPPSREDLLQQQQIVQPQPLTNQVRFEEALYAPPDLASYLEAQEIYAADLTLKSADLSHASWIYAAGRDRVKRLVKELKEQGGADEDWRYLGSEAKKVTVQRDEVYEAGAKELSLLSRISRTEGMAREEIGRIDDSYRNQVRLAQFTANENRLGKILTDINDQLDTQQLLIDDVIRKENNVDQTGDTYAWASHASSSFSPQSCSSNFEYHEGVRDRRQQLAYCQSTHDSAIAELHVAENNVRLTEENVKNLLKF